MASEERETPAHDCGSAGHQVEDTDPPDDSANTGCKGTTDSSRDRIPSRLLLARTKIIACLDPLASLGPYCAVTNLSTGQSHNLCHPGGKKIICLQ